MELDPKLNQYFTERAVLKPGENGIHFICPLRRSFYSLLSGSSASAIKTEKASVCDSHISSDLQSGLLGLELSRILQVFIAVQLVTIETDYTERNFNGSIPDYL